MLTFDWRFKLVFVTFGLLIGLVASEIFLSFRGRGTEFEDVDDLQRAMLKHSISDGKDSNTNLSELILPNPNERIIYDLRPNLNLKFQRAQVHTNSCGMRNKEITVAKEPDTYRIALLGDSFAFGWGVENHETFAVKMEENLNRIAANKRRFEVLNFGIPGYSTFQEVAKFEEMGLDFKPDAVLVYFVQNDFGLPFFVRDVNNTNSLMPAVNFARLLWKAVDPKYQEEHLKMTAFDPNTALKHLAEVCAKRGIKLFLTINPRQTWKRDFGKLWALRANKSINFINLREDFMRVVETEKIPEADLTLSFDPHPSPLRHKILGDLLSTYFLNYTL